MPEQKRFILACDLDNTLIYSKKHDHNGWICVEWIHDVEQAYMSPETVRLLQEVNQTISFVPITSRSIEQFSRLKFPEGCIPYYALCTNGAVLLREGKEDVTWKRETSKMLAPWQRELSKMKDSLETSDSFIRCRIVDNSYLFVYCASGISPEAMVKSIQTETTLTVIASGKKIYLLPEPLNKGYALRRFIELLDQDVKLIVAGDGTMDIPMLKQADVAIYPAGLFNPQNESFSYSKSLNIPFSDFVLFVTRKIMKPQESLSYDISLRKQT